MYTHKEGLRPHSNTKQTLLVSPTLTSRVLDFLLLKAGLQTLLHSQAPSRDFSMALMLEAIMEFTAAGQSEIFTPVPN